ncbi:hypothetical protein JOC37_000045 [Desulfohalotomaculum tongense]|uniref:glycosyltransferase n=1 Tax=Desulforadius tongensis TaxID=1216062 RepID=UPI00195C87CE|nr:glycosyltransferase [Desulforadius tongensis]MBM7853680.1 hypothetical protein [Desulforadius tongensis]
MPGQFLLFAAAFALWLLWTAVKYFYLPQKQPDGQLEIWFCNQEDWVEYFISQLVKKYPHRQLIVVDTGSGDDTPEILKRLRVKYNLGGPKQN